MKKLFMRVLSLGLVCAMLLGMSVVASAEGGTVNLQVGGTETIYTSYISDASYRWTVDNPSVVSISDNGGSSAGLEGLRAGSAMVYVYVTRPGESEGDAWEDAWNVIVTAPEPEPEPETDLEVYLDDAHDMSVGDTYYGLIAHAYGGNGSYSYRWNSSNSGVVRISDDGEDYVTATAVSAGSATVTVTVTSGSQTKSASCAFTVARANTATTYDASASATVGSSLGLSSVANSIAAQFERDLGEVLGYGASVRFGTTSNAYGSFQYGNGDGDQIVPSNASLSFIVFQDMLFKPTSSGTFTTYYAITQDELTISGTISIGVTGGALVTNVTLDATSLTMSTYSTRYLALTVTPSDAATNVNVSWTSSNGNVAAVSGSGLSATVTTGGIAGSAAITATVTDAVGTRLQATCVVTVPSSGGGGGSSYNRTYNPTLSVTLGSDYYGTSTSESMAKRYRDVYGYNLNYNDAVIRFSSTGSVNIGALCLSNGTSIRANTNYTFYDWAYNIHFQPYAVGTFSIPYTLNYNGNTLSGTFSIYVRGAKVSATIDPTSISLATYSNQYVSLNITPSNAYYTVTWSSSNTSIATVSGGGTYVTVNTKGVTGTATISASVRDSNGSTIVKTCKVTVTNSATYDPSVSTTLGVPYTGTGTSTAMIQQFRSIYGVTLNNNSAKIRFATTGNNNVGVMRLANGTPIRANTDYTMTQYIAMYTDPVSTGTFSVPYTLTYNGKSLTGNVSVVITANSISTGVNLNGTNPYLFSSASANGRAASSLVGDTITNAVGSAWSYLRFTPSPSSVGVLYANSGRSSIANTNVSMSSLGSLYFVPASGGVYSISFTVYNSAGGTLANGALNIIVNAPSGAAISYARTLAVQLDGRTIVLPAYALKDANGYETNYVKLRDLASVMNGTAAQFNVGWNAATSSINIRAKTAYVPDGSEMKTPFVGDRAYRDNTAATTINGVIASLRGIVLTDDAGGGYVYYQLRDVGQALGFNVSWSQARGLYIESNRPYTG